VPVLRPIALSRDDSESGRAIEGKRERERERERKKERTRHRSRRRGCDIGILEVNNEDVSLRDLPGSGVRGSFCSLSRGVLEQAIPRRDFKIFPVA
jgi:hypothetical protein